MLQGVWCEISPKYGLEKVTCSAIEKVCFRVCEIYDCELYAFDLVLVQYGLDSGVKCFLSSCELLLDENTAYSGSRMPGPHSLTSGSQYQSVRTRFLPLTRRRLSRQLFVGNVQYFRDVQFHFQDHPDSKYRIVCS